MCQSATGRKFYTTLIVAFGVALPAVAQRLEWRRVGNAVIDAGLAGAAGGPVSRVWYSPEGSLYVRLGSGKVFETRDFESWQPSPADPPARAGGSLQSSLITFRGRSILGGPPTDIAASPRDSEEISVANDAGVWRSLDSGASWVGLNDGLPNLPGRRLLAVGRRTRVALESGQVVSWIPASPSGWTPVREQPDEQDKALSARIGSLISASAVAGDFVFAGGEDGRLWTSQDQGRSWRPPFRAADTRVAAIFARAAEPRTAIVAVANRVLRTVNGGLFWDDITANLGARAVTGVTADIDSGAIYAATSDGLYATYSDLRAAAPPTQWQPVAGAVAGAQLLDVALDEPGNQVFALVEGAGVFAAMAPHRFKDPRVVGALDHVARAAAPGTLLSVLGSKITSAKSGGLEFPILAASDSESQFQVPFAAWGTSLSLALVDARATRREVQVPLRPTSPSIFIDQDGAPMILDADRGVLVEPGVAVRAGSRIQILATGLGRVTPEWPSGVAAPMDNPPRVIAPVRVLVDRVPVNVTRATLAPGYVGLYLVEVELPDVVNVGPTEVYIEAGGQSSGRVTLQLTQQ